MTLAHELDRVQQMSTGHLLTGWFSGVDEQVLKLLEAYPQLRPAQASRKHVKGSGPLGSPMSRGGG
jgi:hypothetical protein